MIIIAFSIEMEWQNGIRSCM